MLSSCRMAYQPSNNVQDRNEKDETSRADNEVSKFVALAFVPILSKEIEGAGCAGLGEELVKVCFT